jgi:hypothetical protein
MSDRKANRKLIRQRHDSTLLIDWKREFDPEVQPVSHANAKMCHADRGNLLDDCDALVAEVEKLRVAARNAMNELGVPQPGYVQPVANAYEILNKALGNE